MQFLKLEYNLKLIPKNADLNIRILREKDKEFVLSGLDKVLTKKHQDRIWEMIWMRWCRYEEICSQKR